MKQHEREYFLSRLRTGTYFIDCNNFRLKVMSPTIDEEVYLNQVYREAYNEAMIQDFMAEDEMLDWMRSKNLWTEKDDIANKELENNLENLRAQIFAEKYQTQNRERTRLYIRATEKGLIDLANKKRSHYQNSCEGVAFMKRSFAYLSICTFLGNELYDFESVGLQDVWHLLNKEILSESDGRELARNEPWRSLWSLREDCDVQLFSNKDRELNTDQRNIIMWSKMYDNIQQSPDCPTDDVIEDDDLLDGWFVVQRRKREKERAESEVDSMVQNEKIANSQEVFIFTQTPEDVANVEKANSHHSNMIKKERMEVIAKKGEAVDMDFRDQRLKVQKQSNEQYKAKFRR